jgi:hypothetical protein
MAKIPTHNSQRDVSEMFSALGKSLFVGCRKAAKLFFSRNVFKKEDGNVMDLSTNWNLRATFTAWCQTIKLDADQEYRQEQANNNAWPKPWTDHEYKNRFDQLNKCTARDLLHVAVSEEAQKSVAKYFKETDEDTVKAAVVDAFTDGGVDPCCGNAAHTNSFMDKEIDAGLAMWRPKRNMRRYPDDTNAAFGSRVVYSETAFTWAQGGTELKVKDLTGGKTDYGIVLEGRLAGVNAGMVPKHDQPTDPSEALATLAALTADMDDTKIE